MVQIGRSLTEDAHEALRQIQARAVEGRVAQELQAVHQRQLEQVQAEGELGIHQRYLVEQIATLRCPACSVAFVDFDGCLALKCGNQRCGRAFCGLCLVDCGDDAHAHVRRCDLNEWNGGYFASEAQWQAVQNRRKAQQLRTYLEGIADEAMRGRVRAAAVDVVPEFADRLRIP